MDNKIDSIDNDGNMTSTYIDNFDDSMTDSISNVNTEENNNYNTSSYNSDFDTKYDEEDEEFDVFGNSKPQKKPINKKIFIIPAIVITIIIIIAAIILLTTSNKYTVKTKNLTIKVKETEEIEVSGKQKVLDKLTYSSKNKSIAKVDDEGNVTGVSIGTTTIYIGIDGKKSEKIIVKVETNKEPLELKNTNITLEKDSTYQLEIKNVLEEDVFTWSSNNEDIATVDETGIVTGIHGGTTTIIAKESDGRTVSTKVTVTSNEILIEKISLEDKTIAIGEKITLKPAINPVNSLAILKWKSNKENIVTVDENGVITGVAKGTATITVESHNGKKDTAKITVDETLPASIKINGCSGGLAIGSPITLSVKYSPDTAKSKITWVSSNTNIATVSNGKVTGKGIGTVNITATTENGKTAICKLNVSPTAVTALKASTTSLSLDQGATKKVSITFTPTSAEEYYTVNWKSSNANVAKVAKDGTITAVNPGTATITASAGGKSVKISVKVNATLVTSVEMTGCKDTILAGQTLTLSAVAKPDTAKNKSIKWSSSDTAVATVSGGKVTTKNKGVVTITAATSNGKNATCKITVTAPSITSLSLSIDGKKLSNGDKKTYIVGETESITATTNLTETEFKKYYKITWKSSNTNAVVVSPNSTTLGAKIEIVGEGSSTIYATVGTQIFSFSVTGKKPEITEFKYSTDTISVTKGNSKTITLTTNLSSTEFNKHYKVTWSSSNTSVASVTVNSTNSLKATIKANKAGTAYITAKVGTKSFKIKVTVS